MLRTLLVALALLGVLLLGGCTDRAVWPEGPVHGVVLHDADLAAGTDPWAQAENLGTVVAWAGHLDAIGDAGAVASRNDDEGLHTAVLTAPWNLTGRKTGSFTETEQERDRSALVRLVADHQIAFLGVGYEIDRAYHDDPMLFDTFVSWWNGTYDAVKRASPRTQVFPVFQYERMIGLQGGLYGGQNSDIGLWHLLDRFERRDLTGFTTHPGLIYRERDHMSDDHYRAIEQKVAGPVAFAAIAWQSEIHGNNWLNTEETQAAFVDWFHAEAPAHDLGLWARLHDDRQVPSPYRSMGLIDDDGTLKPAFERWRAAYGTT